MAEAYGNSALVKLNDKITKTYKKLFTTLHKGQILIIQDLRLANKLGNKRNKTIEMSFHL